MVASRKTEVTMMEGITRAEMTSAKEDLEVVAIEESQESSAESSMVTTSVIQMVVNSKPTITVLMTSQSPNQVRTTTINQRKRRAKFYSSAT